MANLNGMGPQEEGMFTGRGLGKCQGEKARRNMGCRGRGGFRNNSSTTYDQTLESLKEEIQVLRNELHNKQQNS
jgi:hypothetical protein